VSNEYAVVNPATGVTEARYPHATDAQIADVIDRAAAGYAKWRSVPVAERATVLARVADEFVARAETLGAIITREMGKTLAEAVDEAAYAGKIVRYYAEHGPDLIRDEPLTSTRPGTSRIRRAPIGPILGIMPWNFPYYQVARFIGPNLLVGNAIVLKHAPQCPESAMAIEELLHDCGVPADVYVNVFATNEQAADLIADERIRGVSVTGSERAGVAVAEVAGRHLKKVVLELGGSDPFVVIDTPDLLGTVDAAVAARMENGGQSCQAAKRMIVVDEYYDDFVSALTDRMSALVTGDPTAPATDFGPMSSEAAVQNLVAQIDDAVAKGATVHCGGGRPEGPGAYLEPTVLTGITRDMRAYHEELFGPVAVVYRVSDAGEALRLANDTPYGLGGAVFTQDEQVALEFMDLLDVGMVWINEKEGGNPDLPFGGTKRSGLGRELGPHGIDEFVNKKLIHTP
jgi:succinate-semialdehyde dehydrogenase / glutarate-semialdehyde dehydrogenase